jgi:hypothetical protein
LSNYLLKNSKQSKDIFYIQVLTINKNMLLTKSYIFHIKKEKAIAKINTRYYYKSLLGNMAVVAFQSVFHVKIYQNDIFFYFF